jgi:uncharacterized damage-inducible protein DinB
VTEEQRVARNPGEPQKEGPAGAERWAAYLDWVRSDLADGVLGLSYDDQRTPRVPSGWTPLELLSHVLHMEQRWFVWGFLGEQVDEPWGDWNVDEPWQADASDETRAGARWAVPTETTADSLAQRLSAIGERTREILRTHPLGALASPGGRFADDPPTLEWICFHVLAEYARHAGHLDIVAELAAD